MNEMRRSRNRRSRRLEVMAGIMILILCVFCLGFFLGGHMVTASATAPSHMYKYYTEVKVDAGDTLWDIAQEYMTEEYASEKAYIREVQEINSLNSSDIYYGQHLMVPYYSSELK